MNITDRHRIAGVIDYAKTDDERCFTVYVGVKFLRFFQAFGGVVLDEEKYGPAFIRELCETFGVSKLDDLVGKECHGLWAYGRHNESIEGLEAPDGKRFTMTSFRRRHWPEMDHSVIAARKASLIGTINWAERRASEARADLAKLTDGFVDWESTALPGTDGDG